MNYLSERAGRIEANQIKEDAFDFLKAGIIDSMGLLEMIAAVEAHFGITVDFEQMDPEAFTVLAPFSRYVADNGVPHAP